MNDQVPGDSNIEGIISFDNTDNKKGVRALIPVEVKNGDPDKAYFLYVGRISQQPAVFGATILGKSLQDKIDAINAKLALVDENTTEADCEAIDKEITALKAESDLVKDSDFNKEKYEFIKNKLLELAQRKIAVVEAAIEGLADSYTYSMKDSLLSVYADYEFLLGNGIEESQVNESLRNKLKALYAQYEEADALEKQVAGWGKYSYTMYNEVAKANESLAEMETMVAEKTAETIKEYLKTATEAKAIDDKIDALSYEYESEMLEEVLAIEAEVNKFVENGGNEDAFEHIAKLKSLVESASVDILNTDIAKAEKAIEELPNAYSTDMNDKLAEIVAAIEFIEERNGKISTEAESKLNKLLAQKNESPVYITADLTYTRDVFEDVKKYAAQGYADEVNKVYVYPSDAWGLTVSVLSGTGNKYALDEAGFVSQLNINNKNEGTVNGIPYKYGPIVSAVNGEANKPNSIHAADCSSIIEIAVEELPYEELYLAGWAKNDNTSATITYTYADGSTSKENNLKAFKGGYEKKPTANDYATLLNESGILYWRAYMASAAGDQKVGYGSYGIHIISHRLTPDDKKALKSIRIQVSDKDVNVFALTGKVSNSGIISELLDETVAGFAGENTDEQVRMLVSNAQRYMEILDAKGAEYDSAYAETVQQYKEEYIAVESVECYTDIDNRNITVTFSGAISEDSITKQNFVLKKDGKTVSDYVITKISDKVVKITVKNSFDYESVYSLEINANVINDEKTVTLGKTQSYEYDGLAAVDVKVTYKDNKVSVSVKNNLNEKLENFVVMTGAFDKDNALVKFEPVSGSLEAGEEFNKTIDFNTTAEKITCDIIDTLDNGKMLFKHIAVK
ncbi:MAG: Ig-like domain-containing protein [Clostridia bacterium]|nr:Ig-like domain-containing protein [Clostridia bacterium]